MFISDFLGANYASAGFYCRRLCLDGSGLRFRNNQGGGLLGDIYQQSLEFELELRGIPFRRKQELKVY